MRLVTLEMLCFLYQHSAREEGESVRSDVLVNCLAAERLGVSLQTVSRVYKTWYVYIQILLP